LYIFINPCIADRSLNLEPVSDYAWVQEQIIHLRLIIAGYQSRVKVIESEPEIFPFFNNARPTQAGLEAIQHNEFKQFPVIVQRDAPLLVVIVNHEWIFAHPVTSV